MPQSVLARNLVVGDKIVHPRRAGNRFGVKQLMQVSEVQSPNTILVRNTEDANDFLFLDGAQTVEKV